MLERVVRRAAVICVVLAGAALLLKPGQPRVALGILAGGLLIGLSIWGISGLAEALIVQPVSSGGGRASRPRALVKFFTRHAIVALAGYVLLVRLRLDPVGMLIGVTTIVLASAGEVGRRL